MKIEIDYRLSLAFLKCIEYMGGEVTLRSQADSRYIACVLQAAADQDFNHVWETELIPIMERNWGSYLGGRHLLVGYGLDMLLLLTWESLKRSFSVNNQELLTA